MFIIKLLLTQSVFFSYLLKIGFTYLTCFVSSQAAYAFLELPEISEQELAYRMALLEHVPITYDDIGEEKIFEDFAGCTTSYLSLFVADPINGEDRTLTVYLRRPKVDGKVPAVVLVPTIEGLTILEPQLIDRLCGEGFVTILADIHDTSFPPTIPSWGWEDSRNRLAILAIRSLIDLAFQDDSIDNDRIGLMGLSLGAILSSITHALEVDRIKASVLAFGGSHLPHILAYSEHRRVRDLREARMRSAPEIKTLDDYERELIKFTDFEPHYFVGHIPSDRVLVAKAMRDDKVPYAVQIALHNRLGRPKAFRYNLGHVTSIVRMVFFDMRRVTNHFREQFQH